MALVQGLCPSSEGPPLVNSKFSPSAIALNAPSNEFDLIQNDVDQSGGRRPTIILLPDPQGGKALKEFSWAQRTMPSVFFFLIRFCLIKYTFKNIHHLH